MRLYHVSLFTFLFIMSTNILNSLGIFHHSITLDQGEFQFNNSSFKYDISTDFFMNPFAVIGLIQTLITVLFKTISVLPFLMNDLGLPPGLSLALSSIVWLIYGVGIIQLLLNRSLKYYE